MNGLLYLWLAHLLAVFSQEVDDFIRIQTRGFQPRNHV
jgi:hypothetical protein